MAKFDLEIFKGNIFQIIKDNLDAKIDEIQVEKDALLGAANFTLKKVKANAFFERLNDEVVNYDPFIYSNIENIASTGTRGATIKTITLNFLVVLSNPEDGANVNDKMLRYIRALQEIVEENYNKIKFCTGLVVTEIPPFDLRDLDTSHFHKAAGIKIEASFG